MGALTTPTKPTHPSHRTMSTSERKCIGAPEQECINDERQEVPRGPSGVLTGWPQGYRFVLPLRGVEAQDRTDQSLPNPRGAASWPIPSMSALKSTSDRGSCFVSSRGKARIDPIMSRIMSRSASILLLVAILDEFRSEPQPRQRRPKIVGHRRYHARAILVETAQPRLHPVEGLDCSSQLSRSARGNRRCVTAATEVLDCDCQFGKRLDEPLRGQHRPQNAEHYGKRQPRRETGTGEFRGNRIDRGWWDQGAREEQPMAIREGCLDKHAILDAAITGSGLLTCWSVRVDNDNRPRDRQHSLDPVAQQVCIRLAPIDEIRHGRVEKMNADWRTLGGCNDNRPLGVRCSIDDIQQAGGQLLEEQKIPNPGVVSSNLAGDANFLFPSVFNAIAAEETSLM